MLDKCRGGIALWEFECARRMRSKGRLLTKGACCVYGCVNPNSTCTARTSEEHAARLSFVGFIRHIIVTITLDCYYALNTKNRKSSHKRINGCLWTPYILQWFSRRQNGRRATVPGEARRGQASCDSHLKREDARCMTSPGVPGISRPWENHSVIHDLLS
jgi:hypothetical protein